MLGQIYRPTGLALESAMSILETPAEKTFACNIAWGCTNGCTYPCYGPRLMHCTQEDWGKVHLPKQPPCVLVKEQLEKMPNVGERVRSMYGCCGQVVAIVHPEESVIIQMDDGRANRCHLRNFDRLYKIVSEEEKVKT